MRCCCDYLKVAAQPSCPARHNTFVNSEFMSWYIVRPERALQVVDDHSNLDNSVMSGEGRFGCEYVVYICTRGAHAKCLCEFLTLNNGSYSLFPTSALISLFTKWICEFKNLNLYW